MLNIALNKIHQKQNRKNRFFKMKSKVKNLNGKQ